MKHYLNICGLAVGLIVAGLLASGIAFSGQKETDAGNKRRAAMYSNETTASASDDEKQAFINTVLDALKGARTGQPSSEEGTSESDYDAEWLKIAKELNDMGITIGDLQKALDTVKADASVKGNAHYKERKETLKKLMESYETAQKEFNDALGTPTETADKSKPIATIKFSSKDKERNLYELMGGVSVIAQAIRSGSKDFIFKSVTDAGTPGGNKKVTDSRTAKIKEALKQGFNLVEGTDYKVEIDVSGIGTAADASGRQIEVYLK